MRIFAMALVLCTLAGPSLAAEKTRKPVTVPFELLKSKHIVIKVMVNGKGPYRVIFDTGAPVILLSTRAGKESGVLPAYLEDLPFAQFALATSLKIKTLQVGALKAKSVPAVVFDHPYLAVISKVLVPVEGIVGFPFFARYQTTIDYQAKTLTFVPNGYSPPDILDFVKKLARTLMNDNKQAAVTVLAPAAQWGFKAGKADRDEKAGVTVKHVWAGSAAAVGGLRAGDRLLSLDGRWTDTVADCYRAAGHVKPGTAVKVVVNRQGKEMQLTIKPALGF